MHKVIKYFLHTLSSVTLLVIALPVIVGLMLYIPHVQKFAVDSVTKFASSKLGTKVSVDKVRIQFFDKVALSGFYVEDFGGDSLLYAERIEVDFSLNDLTGSPLRLGDLRLSGVRFNMHEDPDSTSNFKKILNTLKNEDKTDKEPFHMNTRSITIEDMDYRFHKLDIDPREGVNFTDIDVRSANLRVENLAIRGDSISMAINHISLKDKSGFEVEDLSAAQFIVAPSGQYYTDLYVRTPESEVTMDKLNLLTGTYDGYGEFVDEVVIESVVRDSKVDFRTIGHFAPALSHWEIVIDDLEASLNGTVADMRGEVVSARINETLLQAGFSLRGLPDITRTMLDFDIQEMETNIPDADFIMRNITGNGIPDNFLKQSDDVGKIGVIGKFRGYLSDFRADGIIYTDLGGADFNLSFIPGNEGRTLIDGNLYVDQLAAGTLFDIDNFGDVTVDASVNGAMTRESFSALADVKVVLLDYNGYRYSDIGLNGTIRDKRFEGKIHSGDPNVRFDFDGMLDFNETVPRYNFAMNLINADLHMLNFNKTDSISTLQTHLTASGSGSSLDDLNGRIVIDRMRYIDQNDTTRTGRIVVSGQNSETSKRITMNSDFADAEYRSLKSYKVVLGELRKIFHHYMPNLADDEDETVYSQKAVANAANYSILNVNVKQANNIASIFVPGLRVASGSRLAFTFNPDIRHIALSAKSEFIEWKYNYIQNLTVDVGNRGDSVSVYVGAEDLYTAGIRMPRFSLVGGITENRINLQAGTSDTTSNYSALIGINSVLGRDSLSGRPQATVSFLPSYIASNDRQWNISGRDIIVDSTMVDVRTFRITGPDQSLRVYGRASRNKTDTLHVDLRRFELEPFSQLTSAMGYNVRGNASGNADIISAMKEGMLHASIEFDSVRVNEVRLPDGIFESRWDIDDSRAGFMLRGKQSADTVVLGYFIPREGRYAARAKLRQLDLSLLDPLFKGIIGNTYGYADADATLRGEPGSATINGEIIIPELGTTVDFMQVPYKLTNVKIAVEDNVLKLDDTPIRDPLGNTAAFDMNVDLSSLSNVKYRFNIRPSNLLVLNTTDKDNSLFHGRVFASGSAAIRGDKAGVNVYISASTAGNSEFYLPLNNASTMGVSDIITFINPEKAVADSADYAFRKRMILERNIKRGQEIRGSNMNINMALNVLPNTLFEMLIPTGDMIRGRGTGSLTFNLNPLNDEFTMTGDYEIHEGFFQLNLQEIIKKRFTIEQGTKIMWTGDPADAILDVTAVYKLKTSLSPILGLDEQSSQTYRRSVPVECRIMLNERLSQPNITFNVEVPGLDPETNALVANELGTQESMSTQFFMLIAANSFMPKSGGGNVGVAGGSATAFELLNNQIANIISNDNFDIGIRYLPRSEFSSNEVTIDFSTQLFSKRLLLEVEGNYDTGDNAAAKLNNTSNLSGDFYLTWLIDNAGNLRLKGFTRTIDRFDENQGMQESGLGIYYKEDFNNVGDIVRNFRDRFSNWGGKKKKRRLEADESADWIDDDSMNYIVPEDSSTGIIVDVIDELEDEVQEAVNGKAVSSAATNAVTEAEFPMVQENN